jgi:hypothetical protein
MSSTVTRTYPELADLSDLQALQIIVNAFPCQLITTGMAWHGMAWHGMRTTGRHWPSCAQPTVSLSLMTCHVSGTSLSYAAEKLALPTLGQPNVYTST